MKNQTNIRRTLLICLGLALLPLAAFFPVLQCGFVYYDDPAYVYGNPHVNQGLSWDAVRWAFTALHASNWHPLTWLSHALDCQVFGLNPAGHHATNLLLHTLNTLLVFVVLRRLTNAFWRSAFIAALFAVHPLHVESVAWVSERKDVLSVFFGLLTLLAYARYTSSVAHSAPSSILHPLSSPPYWLALLCFALSLLSKPMLVTLPCLLLLLDYWPLGRVSGVRCLVSGKTELAAPSPPRPGSAQGEVPKPPFSILYSPSSTWSRLLLEKLPFLLLVLGSIPLTLMAQAAGGSVAPIGDIPLMARLANSAIAVGWYVGKLFWPLDLAVIYPLFPTRHPLHVLAGSVVAIGFSLVAAWQLRRRPYVFTAWFWFLGTLVPVIGLVQVGMQRFADRYTYFSYLGLFLLIAWMLAEFATTSRRRWLLATAAGVVVVLCVLGTQRQCRFWQDSETLFGRAVSVTRSNYIALNNVGYALAERKEFARAIDYYQQALAAAPRFAESLNNLGCAYLGQRKYDLAAQQFRAALAIKSDDVRALNNLGTALHESGDVTNAITQYQQALALEADYAEAHYNLANSLSSVGQITNALKHYQRAVEVQPDYPNARLNYGIELFKLGRLPEAAAQFHRLLAAGTNASNAHFWLAAIARQNGDAATEVEELRAYLAGAPDHAPARTQLAMALAGRQQFTAALTEARAAVSRQPGYAPAHYCLGVLLEQTGPPALAVASYEAALRLQPDYPEALNNLAWLVAVSPDGKLRDGSRAVNLATRACELTHYELPMFIGTLAAAQAEAGQFAAAVATAERAIALATKLNETNVVQRNRELLELYRAGKPFHESAR